MSSIQSALSLLFTNNYITLAIITAVTYEYLITLAREVEYVWRRSWTSISTMFVVVRYVGLPWVITSALVGSSFVPGPQKVSPPFRVILYLISNWTYLVFLAAADIVMILRVYAIWRRSKIILYILLFIYVPQVLIPLFALGVYYDPDHHFSVIVDQTTNPPSCNYSFRNAPYLLQMYFQFPRFLLGVTILVFAITQSVRESVGMYKATRQWQPNRYMQGLVRDGIFYFIANLLINLVGILANGNTLSAIFTMLLTLFSYTASFSLLPRFIINVRELYDHDIRGRWHGIDSGFGVQSQTINSQNIADSAIMFAGTTSSRGGTVVGKVDESEGIQLETRHGDADQNSAAGIHEAGNHLEP